MKYCVINLARAPERYARFMESAVRTQLPWEREEGIDGSKTVPKEISRWRALWLYGHPLSPGHVALCATVGRILRDFLDSNESHILICEDDVTLPENLKEILDEAMAFQDRWDILRLNGLSQKFHFPNHLFPVQKLKNANCSFCYLFGWFNGTGAHLLNRRAAQEFVNHIKPYFLPVDHYFSRMYMYGMRQMILFPYPIQLNEHASRSTIAAPTTLKFWKKLTHLPYLTSLPYRGLMEGVTWVHQTRLLLSVWARGTWKK